MNELPPGFTRCPANPDHVYPSYFPECDVCKRNRLQAGVNSSQALLEQDDLAGANDGEAKKLLAIVPFVILVAIIIGFGVYQSGKQKAESQMEVSRDGGPPPARPATGADPGVIRDAQANTIPDRAMPNSAPVASTQSANPSKVAPSGNPTPAIQSDQQSLLGSWRHVQADNGLLMGTYTAVMEGGQIVLRLSKAENGPTYPSLTTTVFNGQAWHLTASIGSMGSVNLRLSKGAGNSYEGMLEVQGQDMVATRLVKS